MTLEEYLLEEGIPLDTTKLHVIRGASAVANWKRVREGDYTLEDVALLETACNPQSRWNSCSQIAVLIDCSVDAVPFEPKSNTFLFLGVLEILGRQPDSDKDGSGTFDEPAWNLGWIISEQRFFFNSELPDRVYHFYAKSGTGGSADAFTFQPCSSVFTDPEKLELLFQHILSIAPYLQIQIKRVSLIDTIKMLKNFTSVFSSNLDIKQVLISLNWVSCDSNNLYLVIDDYIECIQEDLLFKEYKVSDEVPGWTSAFWLLFWCQSVQNVNSQDAGLKNQTLYDLLLKFDWADRYKGSTPARSLYTSMLAYDDTQDKNIIKENCYFTKINKRWLIRKNHIDFPRFMNFTRNVLNLSVSMVVQDNLDFVQDIIQICNPIPLLPPEQQINAIYRLPDANFLNEMISCHTEGCTIQEMVDTIKSNGAYTQEYLGSLPRQLNRGYDFFGLDGNLVYANEVSQAYAEGNSEPMMLAAFRNFFLLAETLEWLNRHPESSPTQIRDAINTHYPNWNNDKQPADRVWWLRFFGLASPAANEKLIGKVISITPKGQQVLARMDFTDRILIGDETEEDIENSLKTVAYSQILKELEEQSGMILNHKQLKGIHNGLHANPEKRFIILSGLSGTGKTKLLQEYAEAYCRLLNLDSSELVKLVSITPAFRDHTHLLGYLNPLTKPPSYVPGELTQFLLNAQDTPQYPFFLILDEMNLARVEFYLAPILSAMESGTAITLHDSTEIDFPNALRCWPSNVFLAGTVNMDETTHAFSDKVLDRAFTMEFWDIDLKAYFKGNPADPDVQSTITSLYDALKPAHLHFGYRTVKAIVDYVNTAIETDPDDKMDALDQAVFSKVLPKLRGQQSTELMDALNAVLITCEHLALSKVKIASMLHRLNETGLTRFWR